MVLTWCYFNATYSFHEVSIVVPNRMEDRLAESVVINENLLAPRTSKLLSCISRCLL